MNWTSIQKFYEMEIIYEMFYFPISPAPLLLNHNLRVFLPFWKQFEWQKIHHMLCLLSQCKVKCWAIIWWIWSVLTASLETQARTPCSFYCSMFWYSMTIEFKILLYIGNDLKNSACTKWLFKSALTTLCNGYFTNFMSKYIIKIMMDRSI